MDSDEQHQLDWKATLALAQIELSVATNEIEEERALCKIESCNNLLGIEEDK